METDSPASPHRSTLPAGSLSPPVLSLARAAGGGRSTTAAESNTSTLRAFWPHAAHRWPPTNTARPPIASPQSPRSRAPKAALLSPFCLATERGLLSTRCSTTEADQTAISCSCATSQSTHTTSSLQCTFSSTSEPPSRAATQSPTAIHGSALATQLPLEAEILTANACGRGVSIPAWT